MGENSSLFLRAGLWINDASLNKLIVVYFISFCYKFVRHVKKFSSKNY